MLEGQGREKIHLHTHFNEKTPHENTGTPRTTNPKYKHEHDTTKNND